MKPIIKFILIAALLAANYSAPAKPAGSVKANFSEIADRHLSGFSAINVAGPFDVFITQGSTGSVKVEAPSELISKILTEVSGGVLKVYKKEQHWKWNDGFGHSKIAVYITVKTLDLLSLTGSGDASFKDGITAGNLKLVISGSGDMTGKLTAKNLICDISGSGDMKLSGSAISSTIKIVGSGDLSASRLITSATTVTITGSGDADINASQKVNATVYGSGDIHYSGNPKDVSKSKTGSGDISGD